MSDMDADWGHMLETEEIMNGEHCTGDLECAATVHIHGCFADAASYDPGELLRWAEHYGHPEGWAKKAQQLHAKNEDLRQAHLLDTEKLVAAGVEISRLEREYEHLRESYDGLNRAFQHLRDQGWIVGMLVHLRRVYTVHGVAVWLFNSHEKLDGASPFDLLRAGRFAEVEAILPPLDQVAS